jgi:oxalate decarboxylase/phosphoglucose isomerase-like protein (cupin superfamily)
MTPELFRESVNSGETFLEFLRILENDFSRSMSEEAKNPSSPYVYAARGWENITIDKFLGAARA